MSEIDYKNDPVVKNMREQLYQKKAALQTIYEKCISKVYPDDETVSQVIELCKVAGVYIPKTT